MVSFVLNGTQVTARSEDSTPLLWVIRDELKLTGTKFGCGAALCGACTVHVNGKAVRSCTTPLSSVKGARVTTIEGLAPDSSHPLQKAWIAEEVPQCGYCQSGQIMPEVLDKLSALGFEVSPGTPQELGAKIEREMAKVAKVVKDARIRAD